MQYIVRLGYEAFKFESGQRALAFAELAREAHIDDEGRGYSIAISIKSENQTKDDDEIFL